MGIASSLGRLQVGCAVLNNRFDGNCSKREVNNERKGLLFRTPVSSFVSE